MNRKVFIVSEKRDAFYNLTDLIPEMMWIEGKTFEEAIQYFMDGLEGSRYITFPSHTPTSVITEWITGEFRSEVDNDEIN